MTILLTNAKRYELEKDNIVSLILDANRNAHAIDNDYLSRMLNLDLPTIDLLILALKADNIIQ